MRILIAESDPVLTSELQGGLDRHGFTVDAVASCEDAETAALASAFEALVLDLILPDGSGLGVVAALRRRGFAVPVLMLTQSDAVADRIAALNAGADDSISKPFALDEVAARLHALARRASGRASATLTWRDLTIDPSRQAVVKAGTPVRLSRREFSVLHALMDRPGLILSKSQIEEKLYGWQEDVESNTVEVHIHHLRNKLGDALIETVRGVGYRLEQNGP